MEGNDARVPTYRNRAVIFLVQKTFVFKICLSKNILVQRSLSFPKTLGQTKFWLKNLEEVICRINPANSDLFAGLIRQIVTYLPDNQGHEKRGGSHGQKFLIFYPRYELLKK